MKKTNTTSAGPTEIFNPGVYPLWFWNDNLDTDEIRWQVAQMAEQGIRGFYVHARQGLYQPYLSTSFFQMVDAALQAGKDYGLTVHLYDEFPYPSGNAGGIVPWEDPANCATRLNQITHDFEGGSVRVVLPRGKVLACIAFPRNGEQVDWSNPHDLLEDVGVTFADESYVLMGLTEYNRKRYFASGPVPTLQSRLPQGSYRLFVSVQESIEGHKYWGKSADVMNSEVVERFIRKTHDQYNARFGSHFGKHIPSIFVDEAGPGWTSALPEAFELRCGYALLPVLPALQDTSHPLHIQILYDYQRVQYDLFCEAFEKPIANWCRAHNILNVGEKPFRCLSQCSYMDIPGCDPGHTKSGARPDVFGISLRHNARAIASAAYFYDKAGALCECYHSLGWGSTLQDAKIIADALVMAGVHYLVPHGFFYSTHGLRKHDAPPSFFFQMPYWLLFKHLTKHLDSLLGVLKGTWINASVLIVEPSPGLPTSAMQEDYKSLQHMLLEAGVDFMMVDADILRHSDWRDGQVFVKDISASLVIVPPMQHYESELESALKEIEDQGVPVVRLTTPMNPSITRSKILQYVKPSLGVEDCDGEGGCWITSHTDGERYIWIFLNTTKQVKKLNLKTEKSLRELPLVDTFVDQLVVSEDGYQLELQPFQLIVLEADSGEIVETEALPVVTLPLSGKMPFAPQDKNLLRLAQWRLSLLDDGDCPTHSFTTEPMPLANQIAKGTASFSPHVQMGFGQAPKLDMPMMRLTYTTTFFNAYEGPVELVMEPGSIGGEWSIQVNGAKAINESDFGSTDAHIRGSVGCDVTDQLRPGVNRVSIHVETGRLDGGLLNCIYLAGDFAVQCHPLGLVERPNDGLFDDMEGNGLPFYAGTVEYRLDKFDLGDCAGGDIMLRVDPGQDFRDAMEVSINDEPWQALPWNPRLFRIAPQDGPSTVRIRVHTTLARTFEGQFFDEGLHCYQNIEFSMPDLVD